MIDSEIEPLPALPGEGKGIKQAEVTLFTFAEACAKPSAKRFVFHGSDGPVNAVEVDGTFFVQNDGAEAKAARSKALELASKVTVTKAPENSAVAAPTAAAALDSEPSCSAGTSSARATLHRNSYAAAAAKPAVRPKPSAAGFKPRPVAPPKFSAGLERSPPASQPVVVDAPLEVSTCPCIMSIHSHLHQVKRVHVHRTSRWTTLPSPSALPCRCVTPESRETRCRPDYPPVKFRYYTSLSAFSRAFTIPLAPPLLASAFALNPIAQEGEFHARYEKLRVTVVVPKAFYNQSFEAKEAAEELSKKIKGEEDAKEMAKKSVASKRATIAPTKKKTHQKPTKDTKTTTTEQTTALAPATLKHYECYNEPHYERSIHYEFRGAHSTH
jgi:hypothetical protein